MIEEGYNTFEKILRRLHGLYPAYLEEILQKLTKKGKISKKNYAKEYKLTFPGEYRKKLDEITRIIDREYETFAEKFPPPHPLDFEWRFSLNSLKFLFKNIFENHSLQNKKILFLGAPSVGLYFLVAKKHLNLTTTNITIIDKNQEIINLIRENFENSSALPLDLQDPLPKQIPKEHNIVTIDLPWYSDYYKLFISRATQLIDEKDGWIYAALFPMYTRRLAIYERAEVINHFITTGFSPLAIFLSVLQYKTPTFEKQALKTAGINKEKQKTMEKWRYADLIVLKSTGKLRPLVTGKVILEETTEWKEITFPHKKIKVKINPLIKQYIKPQIITLETQEKTIIGRKHSTEKYIDMWTSDNEIFALTGHNTIYEILTHIKNKNSLEEIISQISKKYQKEKEQIQKDIEKTYKTLKNILK